jgi:hypothetical protein
MDKSFKYLADYHGVLLKAYLVIFTIGLSFYCSVVQATENGITSYKNINNMLIIISEHAKSPYTGLIASVTSNEKDTDISKVELSITHDGELIKKVSADKNGLVQFPLLDKEIGEKAQVVINQPKGSISMQLTAGIKPIRLLEVPYDELFSVLNDLETVASELIGLPSWMLPDLDYLEFHFESASTINLKGAGIDEFYQSNNENKIKIERSSKFYENQLNLIFSHLPREVKFLN